MSKIFSLCKRLLAVGVTTLSLQILLPVGEISACSVHDHNCQFHGIGRAVNPNIDPSSPTAVYIVTESVDPTNTLDFDSNVLLQNGFGPYVVSATGFPTTPGQPYIAPGENERHVYPGQYQVDFNANTAQARHSGDLNGLEVVPGATGCEYSTAANCEEIKIVGNIPDTQGVGFVVRQKTHLYNAQNNPNPAIDTQTYAVATGRAYIRTFDHAAHGEPALFGHNYDTASLSGPRDQPASLSDENTYYIGYNDFDPHAVGANLWWNQRWQTSGNAYRVSGQHWYEDNLYKNVTTHKQKRFISGMGNESYGDYGKSTRSVFVGTAPSKAYVNHVAEQQRLAAIEAEYISDRKENLLAYEESQKSISEFNIASYIAKGGELYLDGNANQRGLQAVVEAKNILNRGPQKYFEPSTEVGNYVRVLNDPTTTLEQAEVANPYKGGKANDALLSGRSNVNVLKASANRLGYIGDAIEVFSGGREGYLRADDNAAARTIYTIAGGISSADDIAISTAGGLGGAAVSAPTGPIGSATVGVGSAIIVSEIYNESLPDRLVDGYVNLVADGLYAPIAADRAINEANISFLNSSKINHNAITNVLRSDNYTSAEKKSTTLSLIDSQIENVENNIDLNSSFSVRLINPIISQTSIIYAEEELKTLNAQKNIIQNSGF